MSFEFNGSSSSSKVELEWKEKNCHYSNMICCFLRAVKMIMIYAAPVFLEWAM